MTQILFAPSETLAQIFKHTKEAKKWSNPYGIMPEMENQMHIDLVKDSGIYIMSGAYENLTGPDGEVNLVAYAMGFEPSTEDLYQRTRDAAGGDDFCEPLPLDGKMVNQVIDGYGFFVAFEGNSLKYGTYSPHRRYFPTIGESVKD